MKRLSLDEYLADAPPAIRRAMIADRDRLEPGAAAVVGRLFTAAKARREPVSAPSAHSFRAAAASEATFRTLLRALSRYATGTSTAGALEVKREWVAKRPPCAKPKASRRPKRQPD